jgi:hypothetical protein
VDESVRVLGPGGVFPVDFGGAPAAPWHEPTLVVLQENGVVRNRPGMSDPEPVIAHLAGRARARPLTPLAMTVERTLAQDLDDWSAQRHAWTWSSSPDQMTAAVTAVRRFVKVPGRGHSLTIDHGWQEVAEISLNFVQRFAKR